MYYKYNTLRGIVGAQMWNAIEFGTSLIPSRSTFNHPHYVLSLGGQDLSPGHWFGRNTTERHCINKNGTFFRIRLYFYLLVSLQWHYIVFDV